MATAAKDDDLGGNFEPLTRLEARDDARRHLVANVDDAMAAVAEQMRVRRCGDLEPGGVAPGHVDLENETEFVKSG